MPLSPGVKVFLVVIVSFVVMTIILVILIGVFGPTFFPAMIKRAAFSDCVMISAMRPLSTSEISSAINSCAAEQKVSIIAVSIEPQSTNKSVVVANVDYFVPVTVTLKWHGHVKEKFRLRS